METRLNFDSPIRIPVSPDLPDPEPTNWTKKSIDKLAADIAKRVGYQPGNDLPPIVENLGGRVVFGSSAETGSTGFLIVEPDKDPKFTICLSPLSVFNRDRFTIAHELGHYFLHSDIGEKPLYATRQGGSRVEWEANWFAGSFLMPADAFVESWNRSGGNMGSLISEYRVSSGAIEIRVATLRDFGHTLCE